MVQVNGCSGEESFVNGGLPMSQAYSGSMEFVSNFLVFFALQIFQVLTYHKCSWCRENKAHVCYGYVVRTFGPVCRVIFYPKD